MYYICNGLRHRKKKKKETRQIHFGATLSALTKEMTRREAVTVVLTRFALQEAYVDDHEGHIKRQVIVEEECLNHLESVYLYQVTYFCF